MFYNLFPVTGFPTRPRGLREGVVNACDALKGGALRKKIEMEKLYFIFSFLHKSF